MSGDDHDRMNGEHRDRMKRVLLARLTARDGQLAGAPPPPHGVRCRR